MRLDLFYKFIRVLLKWKLGIRYMRLSKKLLTQLYLRSWASISKFVCLCCSAWRVCFSAVIFLADWRFLLCLCLRSSYSFWYCSCRSISLLEPAEQCTRSPFCVGLRYHRAWLGVLLGYQWANVLSTMKNINLVPLFYYKPDVLTFIVNEYQSLRFI